MATARIPKAVIVGAGLAGLSAANELAAAGFDVQILEASSRPGGRVRTLDQPFADGLYAEAGAMSFTDTQSNVVSYVQQFDLPVDILPQPPGSSVCAFHQRRIVLNGSPEQLDIKLTPEERKLGVTGIQNKYLAAGMKAVGDPTSPNWPTPEIAKLDQISAAQYFRGQGASDGVMELLALTLFGFYGDGLDTCSALFLLANGALVENYNQLYAIRGGNHLLPQAIARRFEKNVHYGSTVTRVAQSPTGITAYFTRAGRGESLAADYLVCAIPFPLARRIDFQPALSASKRELIDNLPNTSVTRLYLQTRTRFWEAHNLSGSAQTDLPIMLILSAYLRPAQRGILECYTSGENARQWMRMDPAARDALALRELARVFPDAPDFVEGTTLCAWDADPHALGAYAYFHPGQFVPFYPRLATPEGRLYFAGDQTTLLPGWMEGALQSGIRAAAQIRQAAEQPAASAAPA